MGSNLITQNRTYLTLLALLNIVSSKTLRQDFCGTEKPDDMAGFCIFRLLSALLTDIETSKQTSPYTQKRNNNNTSQMSAFDCLGTTIVN